MKQFRNHKEAREHFGNQVCIECIDSTDNLYTVYGINKKPETVVIFNNILIKKEQNTYMKNHGVSMSNFLQATTQGK